MKTPAHPIFPNNVFENVNETIVAMPTWLILIILVVAFLLLKIFIYDKDQKKNDQ